MLVVAAQHAKSAEAVRMIEDAGAGQALGIPWGMFQLTNEARDVRCWRSRPRCWLWVCSPKRFVTAQPGKATRLHPRAALPGF